MEQRIVTASLVLYLLGHRCWPDFILEPACTLRLTHPDTLHCHRHHTAVDSLSKFKMSTPDYVKPLDQWVRVPKPSSVEQICSGKAHNSEPYLSKFALPKKVWGPSHVWNADAASALNRFEKGL